MRRASATAALILAAVAVSAGPVAAAEGALDRTYGENGQVVLSPLPGDEVASGAGSLTRATAS